MHFCSTESNCCKIRILLGLQTWFLVWGKTTSIIYLSAIYPISSMNLYVSFSAKEAWRNMFQLVLIRHRGQTIILRNEGELVWRGKCCCDLVEIHIFFHGALDNLVIFLLHKQLYWICLYYQLLVSWHITSQLETLVHKNCPPLQFDRSIMYII